MQEARNDTWQILIRTIDDVQLLKGTEQCPYTVKEALKLINDGKTTELWSIQKVSSALSQR